MERVRRFVLAPLRGAGEGTGHERRCRILARELENLGALVEILIIEDSMTQKVDRVIEPESADSRPGFSSTLAIADRRRTSDEILRFLAGSGTPILLDDNGPARKRAPYLIDLIPGPRSTGANLSSPGLMHLPPRSREPDAGAGILISFGGEDPSGFTFPLAEILAEGFPQRAISITRPSETDARNLPKGVELVDAPDSLRHRLSEFGLVICSYGLTLWEALAAGCAVYTLDPTAYHARLSRKAGIPGIGCVSLNNGRFPGRIAKRIKRELLRDKNLNRQARDLRRNWLESGIRPAGEESSSLADHLMSLEAPRSECLACGAVLPPVIARFPLKSYYRCRDCGMIGMYRFRLKKNEYGPAYFQKEYREQYGRSYLEDFETIRRMGDSRARMIAKKARSGSVLLDIGCAFGPFLAAANDAGFVPCGTDVSEDGCRHVTEELGLPAFCGRFPDPNLTTALGIDRFDVITLWYVIEHFPHLNAVLDEISQLMKPGAVLAFSTPNGSGVSARRSLTEFLRRSPADHYSIWTPRNARRILSRRGYRVYRIRVTGHHPERFPGHPSPGSFRHKLCFFMSRLFGLGDTFEVYAVKEHSSE